jgi:hypothetical protein
MWQLEGASIDVDSLTATMEGAEHREIGVVFRLVRRAVGYCLVKRVICPPVSARRAT